jgi:hypothetical protein
VIDIEWSHFDLAFGNGDVSRTVLPHEQDIIGVVDGIILGEGTAGAEGVHDFHGLRVLDLVIRRPPEPRAVSRLVPRMMELMASSFSGLPTPLC